MARVLDRGLSDRLERLGADGDRWLSARELADIISEVAESLVAVSSPPDSVDSEDLAENGTGADADAARAALADISDPRADSPLCELQRELDEIRTAMQEAASKFLSVAEAIESIAGHPDLDPDDQSELYRSATAIYETAGFQDLAGQRLTRAGDMLRQIELTVAEAQAALGDDGAVERIATLSDEVNGVKTRKMEHILHGPQTAGTANTQEEIDKILASFD